jgi:hypothetical protein
MSKIKYETYNCTRCRREVPWYEKGDIAWRDWEHARQVCSGCREATMTPEDREKLLPKPTAPCSCGSSDFVRAPLKEQGPSNIAPMHMAVSPGFQFGALFIIACRTCGLANLWVSGIQHVPVGTNNIDAVSVGTGTPYR